MTLTIYQVDAFTDKLFGGNPAAVIPLSHWLDVELMQQIAMENNLSETAFFVKGDDGYHLRWFTPEDEIDLCGHATLATSFVIKNFIEPHLQEVTFSTEKAGVLKTYMKDGQYTLDFPSRMPEEAPIPDKLLQYLGVSTAIEVLRSRDYFVVLPTEEAVANLEPDMTGLKELDVFGVVVTAKGQSAEIVSRCFYPGAGIPEDPVTGSAHCNVVPYWSSKLGKTEFTCKQLSRRGGTLQCKLEGDRVLMTGSCVLFMQGEIQIEA